MVRKQSVLYRLTPLLRTVLFALGTCLLLLGCPAGQVSVLERETLFTLELGRLEDQIDIISRDGRMPLANTAVAMRDGFVYLSDGAANKVMEFTSFGDLIRLIYSADDNPEPVTLATAVSDASEAAVTRVASAYNFGQVGAIAIDSDRFLYAEDRLPSERSVFDEELGVELNRIVVRFNNRGQALDYLGQEGVGGTPFPFVEKLVLTVRNELAVVTSTMNAKLIYLYSREGEHLYTVRIDLDRLPVPSPESDSIAVLEEVTPGVDARRVYVKVSYYRTSIAEDTGEEYGIDLDQSRVYWLNLDTGAYEGFVELPHGNSDAVALHYEFVGVASGEYLFFLSRQDIGQTRLIVMNDAGRVVRRRLLNIPEIELVLRRFHLSPEGVLTGLLGFADGVELVWWRTDQILPD